MAEVVGLTIGLLHKGAQKGCCCNQSTNLTNFDVCSVSEGTSCSTWASNRTDPQRIRSSHCGSHVDCAKGSNLIGLILLLRKTTSHLESINSSSTEGRGGNADQQAAVVVFAESTLLAPPRFARRVLQHQHTSPSPGIGIGVEFPSWAEMRPPTLPKRPAGTAASRKPVVSSMQGRS